MRWEIVTLPASRGRRAVRVGVALLLPVVAWAVQWGLWPLLMPARWALFFPVVLLAPLIGGLVGGIGATLLSALLVWYFFLPPEQSWMLATPGSTLSVLLFTGTGLALNVFVQRLRESEERYRTLYEQAGDGIVIFDAHGRILAANEAAATQIGRPHMPLAGRHVGELLEDYAPERWGRDATLWREGQLRVERALRRADGETITVEALVTPLRQRRILAVMRDITARKRLEAALRESEERLEGLVAARTAELAATVAELRQANAGKDAFLAAVSHELRTPLTGIFAMGEMLEAETRGPLNEQQRRYVALLMASAQRLLATIEGILLYTSLVANKRPIRSERCVLQELGRNAVGTVKAQARAKQILLAQEYRPPEVEIVSDAQALVDVMRLLLDNAVKFTPAGGRVDLRVVAEEAAVCIEVEDTGIGMTAEQTARLFQPFQQGDQGLERQFEGLGLGLAYVGEMVRRLGLTVTVESTPGVGSRFVVRAPCGEEEEEG